MSQNNSLNEKAVSRVRSWTKPEGNSGKEMFSPQVPNSMVYWPHLGLSENGWHFFLALALGVASKVKVLPPLAMPFFAISSSSSWSMWEKALLWREFGCAGLSQAMPRWMCHLIEVWGKLCSVGFCKITVFIAPCFKTKMAEHGIASLLLLAAIIQSLL